MPVHSEARITHRKARPTRAWHQFFWAGPLALVVAVPVLLVVVPPLAVIAWRRDRQFRRSYRRAGRLLDWTQARERLSANAGTLIVEVLPKGPGHVWWVADDLRAMAPGCPLAPATVLHPAFDVRERFRLLYADAVRAWCETHLRELAGRVHLVQVPHDVRRQWHDVLLADNAVAVDAAETHWFLTPPG